MESDQRGKHIPGNKTPKIVVNTIQKHISSFPTYCSYYSREQTTRKCLGTELTTEIKDSFYLLYCLEQNTEKQLIAKKWLYAHVCNKKFNLSFKLPGDMHDSYTGKLMGNLSEEGKGKLKSDYSLHLTESKRLYEMKSTFRHKRYKS